MEVGNDCELNAMETKQDTAKRSPYEKTLAMRNPRTWEEERQNMALHNMWKEINNFITNWIIFIIYYWNKKLTKVFVGNRLQHKI